MVKKMFVITSITVIMFLCIFSSSAESADFKLMDTEPYIENETTKIIDHVVYRLCDYGNETHYDVYDWFDTVEAAKTVEEINIVSEIDGIKVKGIQCWLCYDSENSTLNHRYWQNHNYSVKKVFIPATVTNIGDAFFSALDGVEELQIPASVTNGLDRRFMEMESLKEVTFLGNVNYLSGFRDCFELEKVCVTGSVTLISGTSFENCTSLKSFKVLGSIGGEIHGTTGGIGKAFKNCISLEEFVFPKEADDFKIYSSAFEGCTSLKSITLPETCGELTIGEDTFRGCTALETVTLPKNCDSITIGYRAFRDCKNLTAVNNTDNITKIYGGAFRDCTSLKSFTISDKTTMIGKNAFYGCKNLKTVTVNSEKKAPKLYANAFAKTNSNIRFIAKNATAAKSWKSALTKSGLKNAKVGYMHYV